MGATVYTEINKTQTINFWTLLFFPLSILILKPIRTALTINSLVHSAQLFTSTLFLKLMLWFMCDAPTFFLFFKFSLFSFILILCGH